MRGKERVVVVGFAGALISAFLVLGASSAEKFNYSAVSWLPVVAGHPFSGTLSITIAVSGVTSQQQHRQYSIYRDSAGRTLSVPARGGVYNTRFTEIDDLVSGNWYIMDSATQTAYKSKLRLPVARTAQASLRPNKVSLGTQFLLGVQANGVQTTTENGGMVEEWFSADQQIGLILRSSTAGAHSVAEITSLQLGEPSAALFQVPANYKVIEEEGPFTINTAAN